MEPRLFLLGLAISLFIAAAVGVRSEKTTAAGLAAFAASFLVNV